jgi:hypothetical protein
MTKLVSPGLGYGYASSSERSRHPRCRSSPAPQGGRTGCGHWLRSRAVAAIERAFAAPFTIDGKSISLHPSIGCAIAPADGDASAILLRVADERMYLDKSTGAGRIPGGAPKPEHLYLDG